MSFFKFHEDDLFVNTVEANPDYSFYIQSGTIYVDGTLQEGHSSTPSDNIFGVPKGFVSLYESNINRTSTDGYIYPFVYKNSNKDSFKTIGTASFHAQYQPGDVLSSSYRMSASIARYYYPKTTTGSARKRIFSLEPLFEQNTYLSPHYKYNSFYGNKDDQEICLLSIPSIMYGSSLKKGSVSLKYYVTGTLMGHLSDYRRNGELVQIGPVGSTGSGSVAGVVIYDRGMIALTGSWELNEDSIAYDVTGSSKWVHFGFGVPDRETGSNGVAVSNTTLSSSFLLEYSGTTRIQTMTMLAHAKYGDLNHSNNPTFASASNSLTFTTGAYQIRERPKTIKNIVQSQFLDEKPKFEKIVYISKIGLYDENKNLIGVAKVATPVRKTIDHQYTFKIKLDI
jgi:hypothetical protein